MLRSGIPGFFGLATDLAVFAVRDDVHIINNDGFLFLTRKQLVTKSVYFTSQSKLGLAKLSGQVGRDSCGCRRRPGRKAAAELIRAF